MIQSATLDAVLTDNCTRWGIPGLGVGIVEAGEIVYARGFGVQSLETGTPVTAESIFCVASITKCFVACAVMQLVEQRKISLDAPLVAYLPEFLLADDRFRLITLRQMLSHTSGMPDMDEAVYEELVANPEYDEGAAGRYVQALKSRMLIASPGECFAYSNIAYNVLGHLISRVSGQIAVNPAYPFRCTDAPVSFLHSNYQGKGYGRRALAKLIQQLQAMGIPLLFASCGQGEGNPEGIYRCLGFMPTARFTMTKLSWC